VSVIKRDAVMLTDRAQGALPAPKAVEVLMCIPPIAREITSCCISAAPSKMS
jgi:hypothetical protein